MDDLAELKAEAEAEREIKEARRLKKLAYIRSLPEEKIAQYRRNAKENKTEEERAAIRKYNAVRQREYLKTKKLDDDFKKKRNAMNIEYTRRKRIRLAGRPKPETCEICGRGGNIVFEHNHKTNAFRGWTCDRCNVALGMVEDSITVLEKLIVYLKAHNDGE